MTVETNVSKAQFLGSGSVGPFTFDFRFFLNTEVYVIKTSSAGIDTDLTETTDYILTGAGSTSGGSVTLVTALAIGEELTIYRMVEPVQTTSIRNQAAFFPEIHEDVFDKLMMIIQQLSELTNRTLKIPISSSLPLSQLPSVTPGGILAWNQAGTAIEYLLTAPPYVSTTVSASVYGSDLSAAVAAIGSARIKLIVDSIITINSDVALHPNTSFVVESPGLLVGSGVLTGLKEARPEWFGAVGDDSTDNSAAIQKAINSAPHVIIDKGIYRMKTAVALANGTKLESSQGAVLKADAININLITGYAVSNTTVRGLTLQGNNTGTTDLDSNGMRFDECTDTLVENNVLHNFGSPVSGYGMGIYFRTGNTGIRIVGNIIDGGAIGGGGANDISVYSASGHVVIDGNRCYSQNSAGIQIFGYIGGGKGIVTNNICKNHYRHGIVTYCTGAGNGDYLDIIVANNITVDNGWSGIYYTAEGIAGGTVLIDSNVVDSCGGLDGSADTSGGILITGDDNNGAPVMVSNNYVYNSGKTSLGVARTSTTGGITVHGLGDSKIMNNVVDTCTGYGIRGLANFSGATIEGNTILNCTRGISSGSTVTMKELIVRNNLIKNTTIDGDGLYLILGSSMKSLVVTGNVIVGMKLGTSKKGIYIDNTVPTFGTISSNVINSHDIGLNADGYVVSGSFGREIKAKDNAILNCTAAFTFLVTPNYRPILENTHLSGNGSDASGGYNATATSPYKVVYYPTIPDGANWSVNDRVIRTPAVVGQPKSWVCTVAGNPGTWVSEGNL
ncbi:MAG: right-handed parallel beta-helix repeat-containing protein [Deltaproteobacteria bacterium]|nr:right-handed parallel beta-helix repeat-containing protein [Deltaproteobacteria bacterium]